MSAPEKLTSSVESTKDVIEETKKNLSLFEKETWIKIFNDATNRFKDLFKTKWNNDETYQNNKTTTVSKESTEQSKEWWDTISDAMFQNLLTMEWWNGYIAKIEKKFWEKFPTWPYGMVYKWIDEKWNRLKEKTTFKAWENVSKERALKNAKTYYDIRAKERKSLLDEKWYKYNQCQLDSLVAASWWTQKATKNLQTYVLSHRNNPSEVSSYMSTFATTSAWNGKTQPGLVIRRQFESNRFLWKQKPFTEYQKEYYQSKKKWQKK